MKLKYVPFLFLAIFGLGSSVAASPVTLLGPTTYTRTSGKPNKFSNTFATTPSAGYLVVQNGDANGKNRATDFSISLNGTVIARAENIQGTSPSTVVVNFPANNVLNVELSGKPGGKLTITAVATEPLTGLITGLVRNRTTLQPIPHARVFFYGSVYGFATADAAGRYSITSADLTVFGGAIQGNLYVGAQGYFEATPITIPDLGSQPSLPLVTDVSLQPSGTLIQGTVRDAGTGLPIANAFVSFGRNPMSTFQGGGTTVAVYTAADGTYTIDSSYFNESGLVSGFSANIFVNVDGYLGAQAALSFTAGPVTQDFALQASNGALLTGVVTDRVTNQPIPHAEVFFYGSAYGMVTADDNGRYSFTGADLTVFGGSIQGNLYVGAQGYFEAAAVAIPDLGSQPSLPLVTDVSLQPSGTLIHGTVRDAGTGLPIANAFVSFSRNPMSTFQGGGTTVAVYTAADGTYTIDSSYFNESGLVSGFSANIFVNVDGYLGAQAALSFTAGPVTQDFALQAGNGALLTGVVTDRVTNQPVPYAKIFFYGSAYGFATTDADGRYSFTGADLTLFGGSIQGNLYVGASGYFEATPITIPDLGSQPSLPLVTDVSLQPGGTLIQGTVRDAGTGLPIANAFVSFSRNPMSTFQGGGTTVAVYTAADGTYTIDSSYFNESGVVSGFSANIFVNVDGYLGAQAALSLTAGPVTQDFTLQAGL